MLFIGLGQKMCCVKAFVWWMGNKIKHRGFLLFCKKLGFILWGICDNLIRNALRSILEKQYKIVSLKKELFSSLS